MARVGVTEPRIYTPPLRELTPETSLGFSVIAFAEQVLEMELFPWQKWLLVHMLELLPDGELRFRTVIVLIARQNGKSTLAQVLTLWFMYVMGTPLIIGTAQDLDVAEEIWQGAVDLVEETPELDELKENVVRVNGKKALILKSGERYKVKAANRRAGRGLSGDVILLDELREHQSWDAWGAITKTTMARAHALILAMSNAGDATSVVLRHLRKLAHAALGDPDGVNANDATAQDDEKVLPDPDELGLEDNDDTLAIFEWSAPDGCELWDRDGWAQANPSLGHTITERTIASACRTDPEWIFRTEVLCQWSDGTLEGPFPPGVWEASTDAESRRAPEADVTLCVDVSWDRSHTYIGLATFREDGRIHVEVIQRDPGTDWVVGWLTSPDRPELVRAAPVAIQAKGSPAASLVTEMQEAGINVHPWGGTDLGTASGAFYDAVREDRVRHLPQPVLDVAAATAVTRPMGDAWVWDRKHSPTDIAPLVAVTGATWLLRQPTEQPFRSKYEDADLVVV